MSKFYAVKNGHEVGIFSTWPECQKQVNGFKGAKYKSFKTRKEAEQYLKTSDLQNQSNHQILNINITEQLDEKSKKQFGKVDDAFLIDQNIDVLIYTDGSSKDKKGGYGIVTLQLNNKYKEYCGYVPMSECTNQIAELYAIYYSLLLLTQQDINKNILIRSDSLYSIKCLTEYIYIWEKNGYKTSKGGPVQNLDLILKCIQILKIFKNVQFEHVYSHEGEYYNEIVDKLANQGREMNV